MELLYILKCTIEKIGWNVRCTNKDIIIATHIVPS